MSKIIQKIISYRLILLILLLSTALRFWQLGKIPPSPDWDEAALGYNAYSILKTGRDEYGTWFPRVLRSFDDYKPPLYAYLAIPSVALFDLNIWSVRLPSATAGVLAVLGTYLMVQELFKKRKNFTFSFYNLSFDIANTAALLLAISPWHIQFSRIAFEANIGVTINIWAIYAFLKGLSSRKWFWVSSFLFGLGFYAYHSERVFLPLLVIAMTIIYKKEVLQIKKDVIRGTVIGLVTILPLVPVLFNRSAWTRLQGTSSLADKTGLLMKSVNRLRDDAQHGVWLGKFFENRRIVYLKTLIDGYSSHYSLRWLFLTGDNDRHHAPDTGLLYIWELPFVLWGIYHLWQNKSKETKLLLTWFLIAPVAASPTSELPHAIRTMVFLPTFQIFTAIGLLIFLFKLKTQSLKFIPKRQHFVKLFLATFTFLVIVLNIIYYFHMYFGHLNKEFSQSWQYGYEEAINYIKENRNKYRKVVVSTKLEQPHMFFLFYLKYDPKKYLDEGGTASGGFAENRNKFDIFEFRPINWGSEIKDGTTLYVGTPFEIPGSVVKYINYLNGDGVMRIAQ